QDDARGLELVPPDACDYARDAKGKKPPVKIRRNLMQIGKRDGKGLGNVVKLGNDAVFGRDDVFEKISREVRLFGGKRHIAPIPAPRIIEQLRHQSGLALLQLIELERPQLQAILPFRAVQHARLFAKTKIFEREPVRIKVARLYIAQRLEVAGKVGRVP